MGLDPLSPVAPARVRCLLLPCGRITRDRFLHFAKRLQDEAIVRLGDVSPSSQPERNAFSPLAFPPGVIIFDIAISDSTPGQKALYPFEVYREPLVVLGLTDACEYGFGATHDGSGQEPSEDPEEKESRRQGVLSELKSASESLRSMYNTSLVNKVFIFDFEGALSSDSSSVIAVPPSSVSTAAGMKTLMCDLASQLLSEMTVYAKSVQALATIETPRQIMPDGYAPSHSDPDSDSKRQSWFPGARAASPSLAFQRLGQRASMPAHLFQSAIFSPPTPEETPRSEATSPTAESVATSFEQMQISSMDRRLTQPEGPTHDRTSVQAIIGSDALSERLRNQGKGRVGIVIGQMYLAAGRWPDAVRELVQGGIIARSTNDHIWHAKAVETIVVALVMCAWAEVDFEIPPICLPIAERSSVLLGKSSKKNEPVNINETFISQPATKEAQAENLKTLSNVLPEIIHHTIRLYTRTTAEHLAQLGLSETFIRLSKLSTYLLLFPGFGKDTSLDFIVLNRPVKYSPDQINVISLSTPTKAAVAAVASASIPVPALQDSVSYIDRLSIYAGAATVLGMLGYHRKKAFLLRELLNLLLPALEHGPEKASVGLALFTSPLLNSPDIASGVGTPNRQGKEDTDAVYEFLSLVCRIYGAITVDCIRSPAIGRFSGPSDGQNGETTVAQDEGALLAVQLESEALTRMFGGKRLKMDVLFTCMNICEIVPDLSGAAAFASSLLRTVGSGIAPGPHDTDGAPSLSPEDQLRVSSAITHAASTATSPGSAPVSGEYWDDFLVRDVEILPILPELSLTPRKRSELAAVKASITNQSQGPFIVNQFTSRISASKQETILTTGEKFSFAVLLQNLYDVNLEIESLQIDVEGAQVEAKLENIIVGPYKTQRLRLIAQALKSGPLTVQGCIAKVRDCKLRRYPIFRDTWRPREEIRLKRQGISYLSGPRERPNSTASEQLKQKLDQKPRFSVVKAKIVDTQPRVILKSTSIPQDNVMVLEGERKPMTVTFSNVSNIAVDFVGLTFDDSTLPILREAVQDRELPAAELYEVEYGIYKRAAISWTQPSGSIRIEPGHDWTVSLEVLGKPGLTAGTVNLDYASVGKTEDETSVFYTRRISLQFAISVSPSLDLVRNDVFALSGPLAQLQQLEESAKTDASSAKLADVDRRWTQRLVKPVLQQLSMTSEQHEYCLLLLEFYNSWTQSLVIIPEVRIPSESDSGDLDGWNQVFSITNAIDPGQSARFLVPIPRMSLSNPYAPIPSLNPSSKRQFVVSTGKISEAYERSSRDAFWHREEILKHVRVRWNSLDMSRQGWVELRAIRLTMRMLDAIKVETVSIQVGLSDPHHAIQIGPSHFQTKADEFVTIRTRVANQSKQAIQPLLRLQPSLRNQPYNIALDLSRKFAFTGLLQKPLPRIEAGSSIEVDLGSVFLCSGEFEIGASIEEIRVPETVKHARAKGRDRAETVAELDVLSTDRSDRRIWFAKETCKVDVED